MEGGTPIATISVGNKRNLIFHRKLKQVNGKKWKSRKSAEKVKIPLNHGDIFVLVSKDEIPQLINHTLYFKTQHEAKFKGQNGVSLAMVFRTLKRTSKSLFDSRNDKWLWKDDSHFKDKVLKIIADKKVRRKQSPLPPPPYVIDGLAHNMQQFFKTRSRHR